MKEKLQNKVIFQISDSGLTELKRVADEREVTVGAFIRECVLNGVKKHDGVL